MADLTGGGGQVGVEAVVQDLKLFFFLFVVGSAGLHIMNETKKKVRPGRSEYR